MSRFNKTSVARHPALSLVKKLVLCVEIRRGSHGNLCCCVPEVGCCATGENVEDLLQSIQDLIEEYLEDCQQSKVSLPEPQQRDPIQDHDFVAMKAVEVLL
jgi:predicted RNase H-like HicB family nuclease